jgi:Cdc6-like AAA superfamily ATPase
MTDSSSPIDEETAAAEALKIFEREVGTTGVETQITIAGNEPFLKFFVGRDSPFYKHALRETQKALSLESPFRGALGLSIRKTEHFPESLEATALLTLLTSSTRAVAQDTSERGFSVPYVPFQNREDYQLAQPATHVVVGRRGVGKSTLIRRALEILKAAPAILAVIDAQAYATLSGDDLAREILDDVVRALADDAARVSALVGKEIGTETLRSISAELSGAQISPSAAAVQIRRALQAITKTTGNHAFVFLDDFHLLDRDEQPKILHLMHSGLKGANGWLKVAGIGSLLNYYSARDRIGLQVPGDAQLVPLDLTLENPEAAESHLRAILERFLKAIGYSAQTDVLPEQAFRRLAWANAGVPRDFLQMFARAVEHARRNRHSVVTLSDVNVAIGEFGQRKIDELVQDARNSEGDLRELLSALETYCLDENETNGFLLKSNNFNERRLVHILSDLRLVHLISQSITPDRAGERYEAYILDYSLFTGFRRRPNIREMLPKEGQFKASELRTLPKVSEGFLAKRMNPEAKGKKRRGKKERAA